MNTSLDIKKANSNVELKDGRRLLTFNNGFTYWVLSVKGKLEEVSEEYYREQLLKNRMTKRHRRALKK